MVPPPSVVLDLKTLSLGITQEYQTLCKVLTYPLEVESRSTTKSTATTLQWRRQTPTLLTLKDRKWWWSKPIRKRILLAIQCSISLLQPESISPSLSSHHITNRLVIVRTPATSILPCKATFPLSQTRAPTFKGHFIPYTKRSKE